MKLEFVSGNLLDEKFPIFCHQVNCKGKMGAGIARQIQKKYPEVFRDYREYCAQGNAKLGKILPSPTHDGRICINMFSQFGYGTDTIKTNYEAFKKCLEEIKKICESARPDVPIAFPYKIGCGLAGGDWDIILPMLEKFAEEIPKQVYIIKLVI